MKKEPGFIYRVFLVVGDALAIVASFTFAYYFRIHFDPRPYVFEGDTMDFLFSNFVLLPIWLVILSCLGLYRRTVIDRRARETGRLFLAKKPLQACPAAILRENKMNLNPKPTNPSSLR